MNNWISYKKLTVISIFANSLAWIMSLAFIYLFRSSQVNQFFIWSIFVFVFGIAWSLRRHKLYKPPVEILERDMPTSLILLHAAPLLAITVYYTYYYYTGKVETSWWPILTSAAWLGNEVACFVATKSK